MRGEYIGWRYLARNRGAPHFVMTSLSCRRVDNAPRHCRFLRTFDFAGDCRVNFSGVCCIVAREYGGRCLRPCRRGALVIIPSRLSPLLPPSLFLFPHAVPQWDARSLVGPSLRRFQITGSRTASPSWTVQPPVASSQKHARGTPRRRTVPSFLLFCFLFLFFFFVPLRDFSRDIFHCRIELVRLMEVLSLKNRDYVTNIFNVTFT